MTKAPLDGAERAVVEAVREARAHPVPGGSLRIRGGGSSAAPPRDGARWLDLSPVRGIVDLRPADSVVTVRAGTPLAELDAALRERGVRLPLQPWDPGTGTIGGAVAAGADGLISRTGFRWRDHVLGARMVLGTGEVVRTGAAVVKSVAGYDAHRALAGSGGCLAAITCLDIRLEPVAGSVSALSLSLGGDAKAAEAVALLGTVADAASGLVWTAGSASAAARLDALFEGSRRPVEAAAAAARAVGLRDVEDGSGRWADLARLASAPPPSGSVRRTWRVGDLARDGAIPAEGLRDVVIDVVRGRATGLAIAPDGPRNDVDPAVRTLFDRVRRAFDPGGVFQRRES